MAKRTRTVIALVAALSFFMGSLYPAIAGCGGVCCGAASRAAEVTPQILPEAHECCCGDQAAPCEMAADATAGDPGLALTQASSPRQDGSGNFTVQLSESVPLPGSPRGTLERPTQRAAGPPGPLFLTHLALLC